MQPLKFVEQGNDDMHVFIPSTCLFIMCHEKGEHKAMENLEMIFIVHVLVMIMVTSFFP